MTDEEVCIDGLLYSSILHRSTPFIRKLQPIQKSEEAATMKDVSYIALNI